MPSVQRYPAEFRRGGWSWPNTAGGPQGALKGTQRQRDDAGTMGRPRVHQGLS
ncbi:MAG: hypothetical protein M1374_00760 [Firmicutes bacterium]|jgi:hypothetical protein|nr:hypothetical protein [Bacillota bacterium]